MILYLVYGLTNGILKIFTGLLLPFLFSYFIFSYQFSQNRPVEIDYSFHTEFKLSINADA